MYVMTGTCFDDDFFYDDFRSFSVIEEFKLMEISKWRTEVFQ